MNIKNYTSSVKDIKDYLHLYIGCEVMREHSETRSDKFFEHAKLVGVSASEIENGKWVSVLDVGLDHFHEWYVEETKPLLRPLSDMTNDEAFDFLNVSPFYRNDCNVIVDKIFENSFIGIAYRVQYHRKGRYWNKLQSLSERLSPEHFQFILSCGFDLFNLIEAGLAIDKTTLKS